MKQFDPQKCYLVNEYLDGTNVSVLYKEKCFWPITLFLKNSNATKESCFIVLSFE